MRLGRRWASTARDGTWDEFEHPGGDSRGRAGRPKDCKGVLLRILHTRVRCVLQRRQSTPRGRVRTLIRWGSRNPMAASMLPSNCLDLDPLPATAPTITILISTLISQHAQTSTSGATVRPLGTARGFHVPLYAVAEAKLDLDQSKEATTS